MQGVTTISRKRQIVLPKKKIAAAGLEDGPKILGYNGPKATLAEIKKGIARGAAKPR